MVKAIIDIDERTNRVLNIVKAKHGLRDKSQAIEIMAAEYEQDLLEPQLRPEYVDTIRTIESEGSVKIGTVKDFRTRYGLNHDV